MKFTNGYWLIRDQYTMKFATQCVRTQVQDGALRVLAACRPVRGRGDMLDGGVLEVVFTAPRRNIIRVQVTHFAGTVNHAPRFETLEEPVEPVICKTQDMVSFPSGGLTARARFQ